jgi:rhodanese-related sulfurtransferase
LYRERGRKPNLVLLDVREPREAEIAHIEGARYIPLRELPSRLSEIPGHGAIVTMCHHGQRSLKAREILLGAGFSNVRSLAGGIDAWSREIDSSVPRY